MDYLLEILPSLVLVGGPLGYIIYRCVSEGGSPDPGENVLAIINEYPREMRDYILLDIPPPPEVIGQLDIYGEWPLKNKARYINNV
jgi:hypothetical protein